MLIAKNLEPTPPPKKPGVHDGRTRKRAQVRTAAVARRHQFKFALLFGGFYKFGVFQKGLKGLLKEA